MLKLPAVLTHAEAAGVAAQLKQSIAAEAGPVQLDAADLLTFDSSALAVLLDCHREATAAGKSMSIGNLPARLRQLAGLYGVETLIPAVR